MAWCGAKRGRRSAPEPGPEPEIERDQRAKRREHDRVRLGGIAEADEEGDRADEMDAEQEAGNMVERADPFARRAFQLLVLDPREILSELARQRTGAGLPLPAPDRSFAEAPPSSSGSGSLLIFV